MPAFSFPTDIEPGDIGQTSWANSVSQALNLLGPLVGNIPLYFGSVTPTDPQFVWFKDAGNGVLELWIKDS